jgi:anti-sigma regulatory factor (Ser/Thr protein kinase)
VTNDRAVESRTDRLRREWRLESAESSLPFLRRELVAHLSASRLPADELYDVVLAVSEAASNAVEHAQRPRESFFDVTAEAGPGTVHVTVQDHGQWLPPTASAFRGRGLEMMRLLADTTVVSGPHGTAVTIRNLDRRATEAPGRTAPLA